jgi:MFS family permease
MYAEDLKDPNYKIGIAEPIITAAAILGAFIGSPIAGIVADKVGRKFSQTL